MTEQEENIKMLPVIEGMNEVEMIPTFRSFTRKGFTPLIITLRARHREETKSEIIERHQFPSDLAVLYGNKPINVRKIIQVDTYGKALRLTTTNPRCLEKVRDKWLEIFPSNIWVNRVEDFTVKNEAENVILFFERGQTSEDDPSIFSLRLEKVKEGTRKWKNESSFSETQLMRFSENLYDGQCRIDNTLIKRRKPKCRT